MKYKNKKNSNLSQKFQTVIWSLFAESLAKHIISCHKCRKRMGIDTELEIGFSILRSQRKSTQLLAKANQRAIGVLKHSLGQRPEAVLLRSPKPKMSFAYHLARAGSAIKTAAACLVICLFLKVGLFSSLQDSQKTGRTVLRNYYARSVGDEIANEIFKL